MPFEILGRLYDVQVIAAGRGVRSRRTLIEEYGMGRWRKMKGRALIRYVNGRICEEEVHWYEAHGRGKVSIKVKKELN
jgi:hypothetical protein